MISLLGGTRSTGLAHITSSLANTCAEQTKCQELAPPTRNRWAWPMAIYLEPWKMTREPAACHKHIHTHTHNSVAVRHANILWPTNALNKYVHFGRRDRYNSESTNRCFEWHILVRGFRFMADILWSIHVREKSYSADKIRGNKFTDGVRVHGCPV